MKYIPGKLNIGYLVATTIFSANTLCSSSFPLTITSKNQAQFNSVKYIRGLCNSIINNGGEIYENSQVIDFKKKDGIFEVIVKGKEEEIIVENIHLVVEFIVDFVELF